MMPWRRRHVHLRGFSALSAYSAIDHRNRTGGGNFRACTCRRYPDQGAGCGHREHGWRGSTSGLTAQRSRSACRPMISALVCCRSPRDRGYPRQIHMTRGQPDMASPADWASFCLPVCLCRISAPMGGSSSAGPMSTRPPRKPLRLCRHWDRDIRCRRLAGSQTSRARSLAAPAHHVSFPARSVPAIRVGKSAGGTRQISK